MKREIENKLYAVYEKASCYMCDNDEYSSYEIVHEFADCDRDCARLLGLEEEIVEEYEELHDRCVCHCNMWTCDTLDELVNESYELVGEISGCLGEVFA